MSTTNYTPGFLSGGGEMGELTRNYNWEKSSLGKPENWPQSLKTTVGIVLHSALPMFLFWGKDSVCFYNDAYRPNLDASGTHPSLGKPGKVALEDRWNFLSPLFEKLMATGEPIVLEDQNVRLLRNGTIEDVYWTFSYSPVHDDEHSIGGILLSGTETTTQVAAIKDLKTANDTIASQKLMLANFEQTQVAIAVINTDLVFQLVNSFYAEVVSRTREELENRPLFEALPELNGQGFEELLRNVIDTGIPYEAEEVPVDLIRNGAMERIYVNLTYQPQRNFQKEITGIVIICTDVTQQVMSRKKVEENEEHLQLLRDAVPAMIFYLDSDQRYRSYNNVFMEWFNVNATEAIGKTTREFIGEEAYKKAEPHLVKAYGGDRVQYDMHAPQRLGGQKWLSIVYTPHKNQDGIVVGVIVHATDISEYVLAKQKIEQKEKELRDVIIASPIGICVVGGLEARIEEVNEQFIFISGKKPEQFVNSTYWEVFPEVAEPFAKVLENVFKTGIKFTTAEAELVLIRRGVPETMFATFEYIPIFDTNNIVTKILVMVVEVTHQAETRKKIEEAVVQRTRELAESNLLLRRSNEELEQFAYIASHDLQEPIRKISTFTQMLEFSLDETSEKSREYITKIYNSTDRMSKLVRDVLAYSRIREENDFENVNLNTILETVKSDFELPIAEIGATIESTNLPTLTAIASQMVQLFGNLLSNALKFRKPGVKPFIKISASVTNDEKVIKRFVPDQNKKYYHIIFCDNGIGFNQEHIDKIFKIFQRLHGKSEYEGTGIGLAICLKIAHNHGGHISAATGENGGAVFNILLPVGSE